VGGDKFFAQVRMA